MFLVGVKSCSTITGPPFSITLNIFTMKFWNPLGLAYSIMTSGFIRCMNWLNTCLALKIMFACIIKPIGDSAIKVSLNMRSTLQLRTIFLHPCSMICMTKIHIFIPFPTNIGMVSCQSWRLNTTGRGPLPKSRYWPVIRLLFYIITAMRAQRCRARRNPGP